MKIPPGYLSHAISRCESCHGKLWTSCLCGHGQVVCTKCTREILRGGCEERKCGRNLVSLPTLQWEGDELTLQDCVPQVLERQLRGGYAAHLAARFEVFLPGPFMPVDTALEILRKGHTDRWRLLCLRCLAVTYCKSPHYEPDIDSTGGSIFGNATAKLDGLARRDNPEEVVPWFYQELEDHIVQTVSDHWTWQKVGSKSRRSKRKA